MDYTQFGSCKVRIITNSQIYEGIVWGFLFEDESSQNVVEVWTEDYVFNVSEILSIEEIE